MIVSDKLLKAIRSSSQPFPALKRRGLTAWRLSPLRSNVGALQRTTAFRGQICLYSLALLSLSLFFFLGSLTISLPATALLRQHHEAPNVLRYHAQDSLKDRDGNTWQVLLFPENSDSTVAYYLRLVGFPGINSFVHPQPLEVLTNQGQIFTATDVYSQSSPAPNVGQYDLTAIVDRLPAKGSLKLSVPLELGSLSLKIPPEVLGEWQLLTQKIEKSRS